jgi:hypothetical protein
VRRFKLIRLLIAMVRAKSSQRPQIRLFRNPKTHMAESDRQGRAGFRKLGKRRKDFSSP